MSTREENIALLEGIMTGEKSLTDLIPATVYFFVERSTQPGIYICENNGKEYSPFEFEQFKVKKRPCDLIWLEKRNY